MSLVACIDEHVEETWEPVYSVIQNFLFCEWSNLFLFNLRDNSFQMYVLEGIGKENIFIGVRIIPPGLHCPLLQ